MGVRMMIISKKNYHELESLLEEKNQSITTLETKLRLQTTIAKDLGSLNIDLNKSNAQLEKRVKEQLGVINAIETSYKKQHIQLKQLQEELKQAQNEQETITSSSDEVKKIKSENQQLHQALLIQTHALEEQKKENKKLADSISILQQEQEQWRKERENYKAVVSNLQQKLQKFRNKLQQKKTTQSTQTKDVLTKMKLFLEEHL